MLEDGLFLSTLNSIDVLSGATDHPRFASSGILSLSAKIPNIYSRESSAIGKAPRRYSSDIHFPVSSGKAIQFRHSDVKCAPIHH